MISTFLLVLIIVGIFIVAVGLMALSAGVTYFATHPALYVPLFNIVTGRQEWVKKGEEKPGVTENTVIVKRAKWMGLLSEDYEVPGGVYWQRSLKKGTLYGLAPRAEAIRQITGFAEASADQLAIAEMNADHYMSLYKQSEARNQEHIQSVVDKMVTNIVKMKDFPAKKPATRTPNYGRY